MAAGFSISHDTLTPIIARLAKQLTPEQQTGFVLAWGRGVATQAQRNARAKGGRRFWNELARSVDVKAIGAEGVEVFSTHVAAAQKQFGGVIEAPGQGPGSHGAKALTIPLQGTAAEGKTIGDFVTGGHKLFVLGKQDRDHGGVLGYSEDGTFHPLFVLLKRTKPQRAEPWFPTAEETLKIGTDMADKRLARMTA